MEKLNHGELAERMEKSAAFQAEFKALIQKFGIHGAYLVWADTDDHGREMVVVSISKHGCADCAAFCVAKGLFDMPQDMREGFLQAFDAIKRGEVINHNRILMTPQGPMN